MREFKFEPLELVGEATILDTDEFNQLIHDLEVLEVKNMLLERDNEMLVDIVNKAYKIAEISKKLASYVYRNSVDFQKATDTFFVD